MGKGENAGYQHFLLFPQCFQKASILESLQVPIMWQDDKGFIWKRLKKDSIIKKGFMTKIEITLILFS